QLPLQQRDLPPSSTPGPPIPSRCFAGLVTVAATDSDVSKRRAVLPPRPSDPIPPFETVARSARGGCLARSLGKGGHGPLCVVYTNTLRYGESKLVKKWEKDQSKHRCRGAGRPLANI